MKIKISSYYTHLKGIQASYEKYCFFKLLGTWVAQLVKQLPLAQVMILGS